MQHQVGAPWWEGVPGRGMSAPTALHLQGLENGGRADVGRAERVPDEGDQP